MTRSYFFALRAGLLGLAITLNCFELSEAAVMVVEGKSPGQVNSGKRPEELAMEDGMKRALAQAIQSMASDSAIDVRGNFIETNLLPHAPMLFKQTHVVNRKKDGDLVIMKISFDLDLKLLKELLRKEGFFRGKDTSRVLLMLAYQDGLVKGSPDLSWWWKSTGTISSQPDWPTGAQVENDLQALFMSKGFLFLTGPELRLMDLMPVPFRHVQLDDNQLSALGKLFDVQYVFIGTVKGWAYGAEKSALGFGDMEMNVRLFHVEYGQVIGRSLHRETVRGLGLNKAIEDQSKELVRRVAADLSSQIEEKWNLGAGRQPTVIVRVKAQQRPLDYAAILKTLKAAKSTVLNVTEYEHGREEIAFLVELKVQIDAFLRQTRSWTGQGLAFVGASPEQLPNAIPVIELEWRK